MEAPLRRQSERKGRFLDHMLTAADSSRDGDGALLRRQAVYLVGFDTGHGRRLAGLVGRRLSHAWLLWDRDAEEWFADAPVLLDFDRDQLEIQHQKFDDLSITWATADPNKPVSFLEFDLAWRSGATSDLANLEGRHLREISLLEWRGCDMADSMVAVHLRFDDGQLTVYNALDENGLSFTWPMAHYVSHRPT